MKGLFNGQAGVFFKRPQNLPHRFTKLLRKPLFFVFPSFIFFIYFLYTILLSSNYEQIQFNIDAYVSHWKYEISKNIFYNKNRDLVQKLVDGLKSFPISSYEITVEDRSIYKWPHNPTVGLCDRPIESPLTLKGLHLGKIQSCLSQKAMTRMTLFSPIFISVVLVAGTLMVGVSLFPLLGYKKTLTSTMSLLKDWSLHPENPLHMASGDKVTRELVALVKQGVDVRMSLKEVRLELETEREVSKITKQVAHDILSPATALGVAIQGDFEIPKASARLIASSIQRIVETSRDLLNPDGKNSYKGSKIRPVRIAPLIHDIVKEKEALNKDIKFIVDVPEKAEAICSPVAFKRSISNVINNSIESIPSKSGQISCQATTEKNLCRVVIKDNGRGISEKDMARIFEEGFTTGKKSGTGLGLYYVNKKVKEWGGCIRLNSQLHQGTTLEFHLINSFHQDSQPGVASSI